MSDEKLSSTPPPDEQPHEALGQVEDSAAALSAQVGGLAGQLEQFQALLRSRLEDLARREAECDRRAAALSEREQELAERTSRLAGQLSELQGREGALQRELDALAQARAEISRREEELAARVQTVDRHHAELATMRQDLATREAALRELQVAFTSITEILDDAPPAGADAADLPAATHAAQAGLPAEETSSDSDTTEAPDALITVAEEQPAVGPIDDVPDQSLVTASEPGYVEVPTPEPDAPEPTWAESATAESTGLQPAASEPAEPELAASEPVHPEAVVPPAPPIEASERSADETSAAASSAGTTEPKPPATAQIDEAKLDPEVRKRLRIMRRLTGGTVPDEELLSRIYSDAGMAGSSQARPAKPKRRWWGG